MTSFGSASETLSGAAVLRRSSAGCAPGLRLMVQARPLQESESVSPEMTKPSGTGEPLQITRRLSCAHAVVLRRQSTGSTEALFRLMMAPSAKRPVDVLAAGLRLRKP